MVEATVQELKLHENETKVAMEQGVRATWLRRCSARRSLRRPDNAGYRR